MGRKKNQSPELEPAVWRSVSSEARPQRSGLALPIERIDPQIRIAHHWGGAPHLTYPERVLFDHEIVLVLEGKGDLRFRDQVVPWETHDVLFLQPFVPHSLEGRGDVDHVAIHFDFAPHGEQDLDRRKPYAVQLADGLELPVKQRAAAGGAVERALGQVVENFERRTPTGQLRAKAEFLYALSVLLSFNPQGQKRVELERRRAQLGRTITFMRERLAEPLSGADLQRASRLGSTQLSALFSELTGYSPMDYLRRLRIDLARQLLADPSLSIKDVAARTGFLEPNHFSRVFARVDGVPPTAFREALLSKGRKETRKGRVKPEAAS